jgi:hypothetical protein
MAATEIPEVTRRFAALDLHQFADKARKVMNTDALTHDICYTPGVRPAEDPALTPVDRARLEGIFHALLDSDAETRVILDDADFGPDSMAQFVEKVFYRTRVRRLTFSPVNDSVR